ncbi:MAG: MBL fold metallo-hydrolase [Dehalobacterium sp.]
MIENVDFSTNNKLMDSIINVTGGSGGNSFLILGQEKTVLVDCGMAFCAPVLLRKIKQSLNKRTLDYIIISHSHYDHIAAIPYLRKEWPNVKVLGADYAKQILNRKSALDTIRELSIEAAKYYGAGVIEPYDDSLLKVDNSVFDGDIINIGGLIVKVIETQGHTKCSLSFLVNNELLFSSESTGCISKSGKISPAFLTSSLKAIESINKCQKINPRFIISPHFGLVDENNAQCYWEKCILSVKETKEFILNLAALGYAEDQILTQYEKTFLDEEKRLAQPSNAFRLNAQCMIKTVLNER